MSMEHKCCQLKKLLIPKDRTTNSIQFDRVIQSLKCDKEFDLKTFETTCLEVHAYQRKLMKKILSEVDSKITLSVEFIPTSTSTHMCLRAHFVDSNWKIRRWVLNYFPYTDKLAIQAIQYIQQSIREWGLNESNKRSNIIVINSVPTAVTKLFHLNLKTIGCFTDLIKRLMQVAFETVHKQVDFNGSLYDLIEWCNQTKQAARERFMSTEEAETASICDFVTDFYQRVEPILGMERSNSLWLLYLEEAFSYVQQKSNASSNTIRRAVAKMNEQLTFYFAENYFLLATLNIFDPRFKMNYIHYSNKKSSYGILHKVRSMYNTYMANLPVEEMVGKRRRRSSLDVQPVKLKEYLQYLNTRSPSPAQELSFYLKESVIPWTEEEPLSWWKTNSMKYPNMASLVKSYLAIPVDPASTSIGDYSFITSDDKLKEAYACLKNWFVDS